MTENETIADEKPIAKIVAEPESLVSAYAFFGVVWLFSCLGICLFEGLVNVFWVTGIFGGLMLWMRFQNRCHVLSVAMISPRGMMLSLFQKGRFSKRDFCFDWHEVKRIRPFRVFRKNLRQGFWIELYRPHTFWTLKSEKNKVFIRSALGNKPDFIEAIRANVPEEKIDEHVFSHGKGLSKGRRIRRGIYLLLCAAGPAYAMMSIVSGGEGIGLVPIMISTIAIVVGATLVLSSFNNATLSTEGFIAGTFYFFLIFLKTSWIYSTMIGTSEWLVALLGASATGLLFVSLMLFLKKRSPGWAYLLAFYCSLALGFTGGRLLYDGMPGSRVISGELPLPASPWTPSGDAFLVRESSFLQSEPDSPTFLQWYSEDLSTSHRVTVSGWPLVRAIGEHGALCIVKEDDQSGLWWIPRESGEARRLATAGRFDKFILSPDVNRVIFRVYEDYETGEYEYLQCDMDSASIDILTLPIEAAEVFCMWFHDEKTLTYVTGATPKNEEGEYYSDNDKLPDDGAFPDPGELFSIWTWALNETEEPVRIYQAKTPWLNYLPHYMEKTIAVCQIAEDDPAKKEYITLDLSAGKPEIHKGASDIFEPVSHCYTQSPDGRFNIAVRGEDSEISPMGRLLVVNKNTGKERFLRRRSGLFGMAHLSCWSPQSDKFLITTTEWVPPERWLVWRRDFEELWQFTLVVYLIDMKDF